MPTPPPTIRRADRITDALMEDLAGVLIDAVTGGASVGFMSPLSVERARGYWRGVAEAVGRGERVLLYAEDDGGVCGTAQLNVAMPDNQPHRADLMKVLVHRRSRRLGLGAALVRAAEGVAREAGKDLLVLDAVTGGEAARLYERLGWVRVGDIPRYALMPDGSPCSTTYYYRDLRA